MSDMQTYPVLPLRDIVVFPHMVVPLFVGRDKSVRALEAVMGDEKEIVLVTQRDAGDDDPNSDSLFEIGTLCSVLQLLKLPDGTVKVLAEGRGRVKLSNVSDEDGYFTADAAPLDEIVSDSEDSDALMQTVRGQFEQYARLAKKQGGEIVGPIKEITDPSKLADTISANLNVTIDVKQGLLEDLDIAARLESVYGHMEGEIGVMKVEKRIRGKVKNQMEKTQREYYLNEQMKAIQAELDGPESKEEKDELEEKIANAKLTKEAKEKAESELKKLRNMSPMSAEATVVRSYLDWLTAIPWRKRSKIKKDLSSAESVLNADHYGLEKVKERILEYLAVQNRMRKTKGPILCLVGPPGVGKTSLGKSIAKATGRNFVRMSLGGVRDESEIRGHRRTYIGSMPGKVIQSMKKAKTTNPLFMLDEIDKLGNDWRGDPSSALLEVLDPAQNNTFADHYLEVDYDLSDVMFIATANSYNMPGPLMDRMEIIEIGGYTEEEKIEIAKQHLIPRQMKDNGVKKGELEIEETAIRDLIRYYTREAGVRNLERQLGNLARKAIKKIDLEKSGNLVISDQNLKDFAGIRKHRFGLVDEQDKVGIVTGLAYTTVGGDILHIEAVTTPGKGRVITTGKLGDVMKESIQAAESFVKSRAADYGIKPDLFQKRDIHVHVPEGATPKDGPSAGLAMVTSIVSVLTGIPVRRDIAMTGEVTLQGRALPIGGLKEKLLAALRAGSKLVLIPEENEKDLEEVPESVKTGLTIESVKHVDQVLEHALVHQLTPLTEEERLAAEAALASNKKSDEAIVAH